MAIHPGGDHHHRAMVGHGGGGVVAEEALGKREFVNHGIDVRKMSAFQWNWRREKAALALADGYTQKQAAKEAGVTDRTIRRWLAHEDFEAEVDRLTLMTGIAKKAERLRITKRAVRQKVKEEGIITERDLLDWLKFAQGETDGIKLDLTALFEAAMGVADSGPD